MSLIFINFYYSKEGTGLKFNVQALDKHSLVNNKLNIQLSSFDTLKTHTIRCCDKSFRISQQPQNFNLSKQI